MHGQIKNLSLFFCLFFLAEVVGVYHRSVNKCGIDPYVAIPKDIQVGVGVGLVDMSYLSAYGGCVNL